MSAYLVSPIDVAAIALASTNGDAVKAAKRAKVLAKENVKSVAWRYDMGNTTACRSFVGMGYRTYVDRCAAFCTSPVMHEYMLTHRPGTASMRELVSTYMYQACEHPAWVGSMAETISEEARQSTGILWQGGAS